MCFPTTTSVLRNTQRGKLSLWKEDVFGASRLLSSVRRHGKVNLGDDCLMWAAHYHRYGGPSALGIVRESRPRRPVRQPRYAATDLARAHGEPGHRPPETRGMV